MGRALLEVGGNDENALVAFRQALDKRRMVLGEGHELSAESREDVARALMRLGRYGDAVDELTAAIESWSKAFGDESKECARARSLLVDALRAARRVGEAAIVARGCVAATKAALGERHPDYVKRLKTLGATLVEAGDAEEGRAVLEEVVGRAAEVFGEGSVEVEEARVELRAAAGVRP